MAGGAGAHFPRRDAEGVYAEEGRVGRRGGEDVAGAGHFVVLWLCVSVVLVLIVVRRVSERVEQGRGVGRGVGV